MKELLFYINLLRFGILLIKGIQSIIISKDQDETNLAIYNLLCIIFRLVFYLSTSI